MVGDVGHFTVTQTIYLTERDQDELPAVLWGVRIDPLDAEDDFYVSFVLNKKEDRRAFWKLVSDAINAPREEW